MLVRPMVRSNGVISREQMPGDLMSNGEIITTIPTVGNANWTGAAIAGGIIRRTGPIAGFVDQPDTAANILTALRGNAPMTESLQGVSFRLKVINTVAFLGTFNAIPNIGIVNGVQGGSLNLPVSGVNDYLVTIQNSELPVAMNCNTVNASPTVTFVLPPGMTSFKLGPAPDAVIVTPGMTVSGTGITVGTTVRGVRLGQGGIIGVTLSANATATGAASLIFSPTIEFNSLGL